MRPGAMLRALLLAAALSAVALGARAPELEQRSPAAQQLAAELGELQQHLAAHNGARAGRVRPSVTDLAEAGVTLSKMSALLSKVAAGPTSRQPPSCWRPRAARRAGSAPSTVRRRGRILQAALSKHGWGRSAASRLTI